MKKLHTLAALTVIAAPAGPMSMPEFDPTILDRYGAGIPSARRAVDPALRAARRERRKSRLRLRLRRRRGWR